MEINVEGKSFAKVDSRLVLVIETAALLRGELQITDVLIRLGSEIWAMSNSTRISIAISPWELADFAEQLPETPETLLGWATRFGLTRITKSFDTVEVNGMRVL